MRSTRIVFGLTGGIVAASILITYLYGDRVIRLQEDERLRQETISSLDAVLSTALDAETGQRGYIITGDESYLSPFKQAELRVHEKVEELYRKERGISTADLATLGQLIDGKFAELNMTIELRRIRGFETAYSIVRAGEGKERMDRLRILLGRIRSEQDAIRRSEGQRIHVTTQRRSLVFMAAGAANVVCVGWGYRRIRRALHDRALAIENAQRKSDLFSTTLASIGDCVIVTDARGRITFMNSVAAKVTGWTEGGAKPPTPRNI
jgi:CHASE3 domain sensor protein